jgi:hypothetical protein
VAAPFGANVGGCNPLLVSASPDAAFDSWLTVGITDGDSAGWLSSIGIDWTAWTIAAGLTAANGAVFWMSPGDGPAGRAVIAQVTVPAGAVCFRHSHSRVYKHRCTILVYTHV